jgi:sugar fermentation stimulation protein A
MKFEKPLEKAFLLSRYKRFLCDVRLQDGSETTIYCPNTGSMKNCCPKNAPIWFSRSANKKRKYECTWELVETPEGHKIGINSSFANQLVVEAIENNIIKELLDFETLQTEVKYGEESSRIDILLSKGKSKVKLNDQSSSEKYLTYIEVKSVTLLEDDGWGYFPDAVSTRGQKHIRELISVVKQGHRAVLLFCIQHSGIHKMKAAAHIDPKYAQLLKQADQAGVEILSYACDLNDREIKLVRKTVFSFENSLI